MLSERQFRLLLFFLLLVVVPVLPIDRFVPIATPIMLLLKEKKNDSSIVIHGWLLFGIEEITKLVLAFGLNCSVMMPILCFEVPKIMNYEGQQIFN